MKPLQTIGTTRAVRGTRTLLLATLTIVALMSLVPSPAHAYGNLNSAHAYVSTENGCFKSAGELTVNDQGAYCVIYDAADNTWFHKDPGGTATKVEFYQGGSLVAKVEFHPYDEVLWVYDTANDGDTIYVTLQSGGHGNWGKTRGPYSVSGSNDDVESNRVDMSYDEGEKLRIRIWDDAGATEFLGELFPVT